MQDLKSEPGKPESALSVSGEVLRHRHDAGQALEQVRALMDALAESLVVGSVSGESVEAARRRRMDQAIELPQHASALCKLSEALKVLIGLERQAYNLNERKPGVVLVTVVKGGE